MFTTIQTYITSNNLNISKQDFINLATVENTRTIPSGIKYNILDLDNLVIKHSFSCRIKEDFILKNNESIKTAIKKIYLMKIYDLDNNFTGKCKIGISEEPEHRAKTISKEIPFVFKVHIASKETSDAYIIEQAIHKLLRLKKLGYEPNHKFEGSTELFEYKEWMDYLVI